jgi:hypothetical protein
MQMGNGSLAAAEKAARENRIFLEFLKASGLPIDPVTVENRSPPEPDIRCVVHPEGPVAFELVELCNSELAKDIGDQVKRGTKAKFHMLDDPGPDILRSKLGKRYGAKVPIELVCYTGRTAVPNDLGAIHLREVTDKEGTGLFRRIWYLGNKV